MKNTDIAAIILIASISMLAAYFIADGIVGRPGSESVKVKTVDEISADIVEPDATVFNKDAINPTVPVTIGEGQTAGSDEQQADAERSSQQDER